LLNFVVKMWRRMIIEIHLDTATVEAFQRGHMLF
jgi:hypothetical protein